MLSTYLTRQEIAGQGLTTTLERTNLATVRSPTYRLLDHLLKGGLDVFVADRRARGRSWRRIAQDILEVTGVDVTYETIRSWYPAENGRAKVA